MTKLLVIIAVCLTIVRAQIPNLGWCPDLVPMSDFNMDRYLGTWYEQERYFRVMEAGSRCVRTNYTKAVDGRILVASEITGRLSGVKRILDGEIPHLIKGAESRINVKYSTLPFQVDMSYTVLDTDYDTYSVVWSCSGLGPVHTESAWLMTRERLPPGTVLQKAYGVLDSYKISRSFFVKTDQADCAIAEAAAVDSEKKKTPLKEKSAGTVAEVDEKSSLVVDSHVKEVEKYSESQVVPEQDGIQIPVFVENQPNSENFVKVPVVESHLKPVTSTKDH